MKKILAFMTALLLTSTVLLWHTSADWFWDHTLVNWYSVPGTNTSDNDDKLIDVIKVTVNRVLWILSLIALLLCLWWWFQMLTAAGDESKVKTWTKVLKHAAIWLAIIWLSRLLVSFIFWLIKTFTTGAWA